MASSSTLPYFWQLASASTSERLTASHKLVSALGQREAEDASEDAGERQLFDDGLSQGVLEASNDEFNAAEAALAEDVDGEVAYAVRRLIKGLASHRESARLGFAVALAEILKRHPAFHARHALVLVLAYSRTNAKVRGQEERDLFFSRLFGIATLLRASVLTRQGDVQHTWRRAVEVLFALGQSKTWLRESTASVIVSAVEALQGLPEADAPAWRDDAFKWLAERLCSGKEASPETVAIYIALKRAAPQAFKSSQRLPHFASPDVLASPDLGTLARVLRGAASDEEDDDDDMSLDENGPSAKADADRATGSSSTQAHFVWDLIFRDAMAEHPKGKTTRAPFAESFRVLVDDSLFHSAASHQKKAWGFQIVERALRQASPKHVSDIFGPNLLRTFINQLSDKKRVLHQAAQKLALALHDVVKNNPELGLVAISHLCGPQGTQRFDETTRSKTIEGILRNMRADDVTQYCLDVMSAACSDVTDAERKHRLDQLLVLVRDGQIATSSSCCEEIVAFFAAHGFFEVKSAKSLQHASLKLQPQPAFSSGVQSACRSRLLSCLGHLHSSSSNATNGANDGSAMVKSWPSKVQDILHGFERDSRSFASLTAASSASMKAAMQMVSQLGKASSKANGTDTQEHCSTFRDAVIVTVLYSRCNLVGASDTSSDVERASELIDPLVDCGERLLLGKKAQSGEPSVGEVLVHSVATLLEEPSVVLRNVATQVFVAFSDVLTREGIKQMIHSLGFDAEGTADAESDEASDAEEGDDSQEEMSDTMSVTSATSSPSDSAEDDGQVDEKFAGEVRAALKAGGIADADEKDSSDEADDDSASDNDAESVASDFDDEQMMMMDDKLADIFRQKFASRKEQDAAKKETIAFHIKIVDLLDHFLKRNSESSVCIDTVLPLLTIALEKDPAMDQLKARASSVLEKTLGKAKSWPTNVSADDLVPALEAVHKLASTGTVAGAQAQLVATCNVYLTRAASSEALQGPIARVYADTLDDFISRKASNLKPHFLISAFERFPGLTPALQAELLKAASGPQESSQHSFRQLQALEMLRVGATQLVAQGDSDAGRLAPLLTQVRTLVLERVRNDELRLKDLLKTGLQFVRLTKRLADKSEDAALLSRVWPAAELDAALSVLAARSLANSKSLENLLRQMSSIASGSSGATVNGDAQHSKKRSKKAKRHAALEVSIEISPSLPPQKRSKSDKQKGVANSKETR